MIDKLKAWCRNSLTIAWARLQVAAGLAIVAAGYVFDLLNAAAVAGPMGEALGGKYKWFLIASGLVTELARRRKGSLDKVA